MVHLTSRDPWRRGYVASTKAYTQSNTAQALTGGPGPAQGRARSVRGGLNMSREGIGPILWGHPDGNGDKISWRCFGDNEISIGVNSNVNWGGAAVQGLHYLLDIVRDGVSGNGGHRRVYRL